MKHKQTITLDSKPSNSIVKRLALLTFGSMRGALHGSTKITTVINQAASDVRDAWRETARSNA